MKNIFKGWTTFEKILLFGSIILVSIVGVVFKSDLLTTACSIVGITTALLLAKGKNLGQIFGLLIVALYSIVSFKNRYYGEVIIYLCIMLPMYIMGIVSWIKHQNKETDSVEVNTIKAKEWCIVSVVAVIAFVLIYFLLKAFNTDQLFVSSLSVIDSLFAIYLGVRRSKYSFYFYVVNDLILIVLWGIPVIGGNLVLIPMLFNPIINLINDLYGIYNWRKLEKIQKKE
ncbi:MAG TPA: nicotinamide riboside transporter PnuC [Candidatus Dojkabacteria bacterium]|nr:nicotinamide riboside transporter PnuC [Candidatus Dojkabacteria bacterium]